VSSTSGLLDPATLIQNIGKNLLNDVLTSEETWIFSYATVRTFKYYRYRYFCLPSLLNLHQVSVALEYGPQ